jgi:hypothetical protein
VASTSTTGPDGSHLLVDATGQEAQSQLGPTYKGVLEITPDGQTRAAAGPNNSTLNHSDLSVALGPRTDLATIRVGFGVVNGTMLRVADSSTGYKPQLGDAGRIRAGLLATGHLGGIGTAIMHVAGVGIIDLFTGQQWQPSPP